MPGLGYFYVRQLFLGVVHIIVELILIGLLISFYLQSSQHIETVILPLVLFGGLYIFQKIAVMVHSNRFIDEYMPEIAEVRPLATL